MSIIIYFAGSISGGRGDQAVYVQIIKELQKYGQVLTEHVADEAITALGETALCPEEIYRRDIEWLTRCDVVVAEVSTISHGVGYEIGKAEAMDKSILCLYCPTEGKRLSAMIAGNQNLIICEYKDFAANSECIREFFT